MGAAGTARAVEKAGVVGAGGGAFPTHVKASARADTVLANGAECEPLLLSDSAVMTTAADRVLRGLSLMAEAVGATRAVVAVKAENSESLAALERAAAGAGVELLVLENVYPAGDEFLLVNAATGRVVPEGGYPTDVGVVVDNVTTLSQVADAVEGRPVTRRLVTVHGEVHRPGAYAVPIGTRIGDVIDAAGPRLADAAVLMGGPMMGRLAAGLEEPTTKALAGLIVLPRTHRLVTTRAATEAHVLRVARASCCQCLACTELCPRALLGHALSPHRTVRAVQYDSVALDRSSVTSAFLCSECGMCELFACPLEIQPRRILADLKAELRRVGVAVAPRRVILKLDQHAGAPAVAAAAAGDRVLEGDVVAEIAPGTLGARLHASVTGVVASASADRIVIDAD